jgi:hypothetical protein
MLEFRVGSVEREASVKTIWDRLLYVPRAMAHWVDRKKSILGSKSRGAKIGPLRGRGVVESRKCGVGGCESRKWSVRNRGLKIVEGLAGEPIKAARRTCLGCGGRGAVFCPLIAGT